MNLDNSEGISKENENSIIMNDKIKNSLIDLNNNTNKNNNIRSERGILKIYSQAADVSAAINPNNLSVSTNELNNFKLNQENILAFSSKIKKYNEKVKEEFNQFLNNSLMNNPFEDKHDKNTRNPLFNNSLKIAGLAKLQMFNRSEINSPNTSSFVNSENFIQKSDSNSVHNSIEKNILEKFNNSIQNLIHDLSQSQSQNDIMNYIQNCSNDNLKENEKKSFYKAVKLVSENEGKNSMDIEDGQNGLIYDSNKNNIFQMDDNYKNNNFNYDTELLNNEKLRTNNNNNNNNIKNPDGDCIPKYINDKLSVPKSLENLKNKVNLKVKIPITSQKEAFDDKNETLIKSEEIKFKSDSYNKKQIPHQERNEGKSIYQKYFDSKLDAIDDKLQGKFNLISL